MEERNVDGAIGDSRVAFVAALRAGDARAASSVYAARARLLPPSAELLQGRAAIAAFWQAGIDAGLSAVELETLEVEGNGGMAYEIGRYALRVDATEGTLVDRGKYLLVHERQDDGSWRWAVEMFSPDAPPAKTGSLADGRKRDAAAANQS